MKAVTFTKRTMAGVTLALLAVVLMYMAAVYLSVDVISVTLPPWDTCGFHSTKAGEAFICIGFDVDTIRVK